MVVSAIANLPMKTDKELYRVFEACPEWVFLLTQLPSPGNCRMRSVTVKELELRLDGLIEPLDATQPLTVVEFQNQADDEIYFRVAREMVEAQKLHPGRDVQGVVFFKSRALDPQTQPWARIVKSFVLSELLEALEIRQPSHPLVAAFKPLLLKDETSLEANAVRYYKIIKRSRLKTRIKRALLETFVSWLEQRFKNRTKQEVEAMLLGELPSLEETQSGKDLIRIGQERGRNEGFGEAIEAFLLAKFGRIPKRLRGALNRLTLPESQQLIQHLPHWDSLDDVEAWLKSERSSPKP